MAELLWLIIPLTGDYGITRREEVKKLTCSKCGILLRTTLKFKGIFRTTHSFQRALKGRRYGEAMALKTPNSEINKCVPILLSYILALHW